MLKRQFHHGILMSRVYTYRLSNHDGKFTKIYFSAKIRALDYFAPKHKFATPPQLPWQTNLLFLSKISGIEGWFPLLTPRYFISASNRHFIYLNSLIHFHIHYACNVGHKNRLYLFILFRSGATPTPSSTSCQR